MNASRRTWCINLWNKASPAVLFFFLFFVHSYPRFQNAAGHRGCLPHTGAVGSDQSWVLLNSFGMELAATGPVDLEVTLLCWNVATTRFINSTNSLMFPFSVMKLSALTVEYFYYFITADRKEWLRSVCSTFMSEAVIKASSSSACGDQLELIKETITRKIRTICRTRRHLQQSESLFIWKCKMYLHNLWPVCSSPLTLMYLFSAVCGCKNVVYLSGYTCPNNWQSSYLNNTAAVSSSAYSARSLTTKCSKHLNHIPPTTSDMPLVSCSTDASAAALLDPERRMSQLLRGFSTS